MPRIAPRDGHDKFSRYRAAKRRQGMKLLRIWVPDPNAPGFAEEARRQAQIINSAPDAAEIERFIEGAIAELDLPPYDWGPGGPPPRPDREEDKGGSPT